MRRLFWLILFLNGVYTLSAQEFNQAVVNELQECIKYKEFDKGDSIINSFRGKDLSITSSFWLNLIHSDIGISRYRQSYDINDYKKYINSGIEAFRFLSQHINKDNAANSINCWDFLFYWSEIYTQLNNVIIDSISVFSDKYYNDYGQKKPEIYYLVQRKIYNYYFDRQDWRKCIDIMTEVERAFRNDSLNIKQSANVRFDLGLAYLYMKDIKSAEKWCLSAYRCFQEISNKEQDKTYGQLLYILSKIYYQNIGDAAKAYIYSVEAERINKKIYGESTKMYVASLVFLSNLEFSLNKTQEGLKHLENVVALIDNVPDMDKIEKQMHRDKLKLIYRRLNIKKDVASQDTIVTENSIILGATDAFAQGDWETSISKLSFLLNSYETNYKTIDVGTYIYIVGSLSNVLVSSGDYIKADSVLSHAITLIQNTYHNTLFLKDLYVSKGLLYYTINNIDMALHWYNIAKDMYNEEEKKGIKYALLQANISLCYVAKEDLSIAKQLSEEAYDLCTQFYGKNAGDANDQLLLLNNLATIYAKMKDFSKCKELYRMVIESSTSKQHEGTKALAMMNLAEIYFQEKNFNKAEEYLVKCMNLDAASYVKDMANFDLLLLHCLTHNNNTLSEIKNYNDAIIEGVADIFAHFSESERENYWTQKSQTLVALNNLAALNFSDSQTSKTAYNNALFTKNMLLDSGRILGQVVKGCGQEIQDSFSLMNSLKRALSNKRTPKDSLNTYSNRISMLEKQIISSIPDIKNRIKKQFKSIDDIQKMLSDGDVAIEFIFLPQIKVPIENSELQYGALVLTKKSAEPILIPLCTEYELENVLDVENSTSQEFVDNLYNIQNTRLYKMLWAGIEPYIHKGSTIYYSPIGYINKINMSVISDGKKRLQDMYEFCEVSTTALIGEIKQQRSINLNNAVLFGDINYNEDVDIMEANSIKYEHFSSIPILSTRSLNRSTWELLPGTKEEIIAIAKQMVEKGLIVRTYSQNDANEESIKALNARAPDIIHIATHGFYYSLDDDITSKFFGGLSSNTQKDHSLLYSGLLFAGANNSWAGKTLKDNIEDGIMTAYEVSQLDLSGNKLTVLSACNTGLGDIDNIDGVFGLQRAFKKAGVGTILMSLWKVPDEETKQLMSSFYNYLLSGNTSHQALLLAQKQLIGQGKSPFYWAGFILLD